MRVNIISVANKPPTWVKEGIEFYEKRLQSYLKIQWTDIDLQKLPIQKNAQTAMKQQSELILQKISNQDHVIALAIKAPAWSTGEFAKELQTWLSNQKSLCFLIGGPDGLHEQCLARANQQFSLSTLTFPHQLVRIILIEQLYRAISLLHNHPYHR